jgi:hypothetical protein
MSPLTDFCNPETPPRLADAFRGEPAVAQAPSTACSIRFSPHGRNRGVKYAVAVTPDNLCSVIVSRPFLQKYSRRVFSVLSTKRAIKTLSHLVSPLCYYDIEQ